MVTARHDTDELRFLGEDLRDVMSALVVTFDQAAKVQADDVGSPHLSSEIERFREDWRMGERRIVDNLIDAIDFLQQAADAYEQIEASAIAAMGPES